MPIPVRTELSTQAIEEHRLMVGDNVIEGTVNIIRALNILANIKQPVA